MADEAPDILVVAQSREDASALAARLGIDDTARSMSVEEIRAVGGLPAHAGLVLAPGIDPSIFQKSEQMGSFSEVSSGGSSGGVSAGGIEDQAEILLNAIGEGICLCEADGRAVWANERFKKYDQRVIKRVAAVCRGAFSAFAAELTGDCLPQMWGRRKRYNLRTKQSRRSFEVDVTPVIGTIGDEGEIGLRRVAAVVRDVTARVRMQEKIDALDRAGRELVNLEAEAIEDMHVAERLALLEQKVIKFAHDLMHFDHFAIRFLDSKTGKLELVMSAGLPPEAVAIELYADTEGDRKSVV